MPAIRLTLFRSALLQTAGAVVILSAPLMVGACSPKDKGASAEKSSPVANLNLKSPSSKAFAKHFDVPSRQVSEDEAKEALEDLSLLKSSEANLSWKKAAGKAGNYTYTDLAAKNDDGTLSIDSAKLFGVHMVGDTATFDRADFSGIKIFNEDDNVTVTFATMSMARPTPAMAKSIIQSLSSIKDIDDLELKNKNADMGFGAVSLGGMKIESEELNGTIKQVIWGKDEDTDLTDFLVDDIGFNFDSKQGNDGKFKLGQFSAIGLSASLLDGMRSRANVIEKINSLGKTFEEVKLENLSFDSSTVAVNTKGFAGKAVETGHITTITQVSQPFTITLKDAPNSPQAAQAFAMVKELGFDELVFETSQTQIIDSKTDTVSVNDGLITLKDGFDLSYNYEGTGLNELQSNLNSDTSNTNLEAALQALTINGLQLRLEDKSIVERGLGLAAKFRGASPEQLKKEMKLAVTLAPLAAGSGLERDLIKEMGGALTDFIGGNGKTLSIVITPEAPIALTDLANLKNSGTSMKALGFTAKTE